MPRLPKRMGRPRKGEEPSDGLKAAAALKLLKLRWKVDEVCRWYSISARTLYLWIRDVAASDHPDAPEIARLAADRRLGPRQTLGVAG